VTRIHGPLRTIAEPVRAEIIKGTHRLKEVIEPKPSPWRKRFEMIATAIGIAVIVLKFIIPKKTEK
jgi:hypothetical protein